MTPEHKKDIAILLILLSIFISRCSLSTLPQTESTVEQSDLTPKISTNLPAIIAPAPKAMKTDALTNPTQASQSTDVALATSGYKQPQVDPFYGMEFVPANDLESVKGLGIEVVLSVFSHGGTSQSWIAYLEEAHALGIKVIGRLWPEGWHWDGSDWQIDLQTQLFIQTLANHPATLAVYALEEPYWQGCWECGYTTEQLQLLYKRIKEIAPVPVYSEVDSMSFWTKQGEDTAFADGICDYCASWFYPFLEDGSYKREELIKHITNDLAVARSQAPDSKFIWLMQGFAQDTAFRLPTAQEMYELAEIVYDLQVDGALWYCWNFGSLYSDFLSQHPELYPVIREIHDEIVTSREE